MALTVSELHEMLHELIALDHGGDKLVIEQEFELDDDPSSIVEHDVQDITVLDGRKVRVEW